jgi:endonuclease/exonuclease/phosphatase family metal-dependent hydrolase
MVSEAPALRESAVAEAPAVRELAPSTGAHAETVAIASYNIHSGVGMDRRRSAARIAQVLKELDCDIYALQEVDNRPGDHEESMQLEYLARVMGMHAIPGLRIVRHTGEYGNAVLTRLPILGSCRHDLSCSRWEPRGAIDLRVDVDGSAVRVIATHLGLSRSERRTQWLSLLAALAAAPSDLPTVLLGDMNEWYRPSATLQQAHRVFGEPPAPVAFPSFAPCLALTRIWVRPLQALRSLQVHRSKLARSASDHLPVKAVIDVAKVKRASA